MIYRISIDPFIKIPGDAVPNWRKQLRLHSQLLVTFIASNSREFRRNYIVTNSIIIHCFHPEHKERRRETTHELIQLCKQSVIQRGSSSFVIIICEEKQDCPFKHDNNNNISAIIHCTCGTYM